jgi:dTDP-4-amino-4,6-dideoxygalactose transaminase
VRDAARRDALLPELTRAGVNAVTHYVPLHSAPAGIRFGRTGGPMTHTDDVAARQIRLPLHPQLTHEQQDFVLDELRRVLE